MKYFAAEGGRVTKIIPTDKPGHSRRDVSAF
ncbi:DotI/IcmL family type IV secretion protein, partial [Pseudomonas amygdali]